MNRKIIESKYRSLGLEKGWTFLTCPEARLRDAAVAIIGTNPGGGGPKDSYPYTGIWSCETMNAFYDEPTRHRAQVRLWHELASVDPRETLCAQFIPFRSPDLKRLNRLAEAEAFARELWSWVLSISPARLFITMGPLPAKHLVDLLGAKPFVQNFPTGWGATTIDVFDSAGGARVIRMPHPSQFGVLGRIQQTDDFFRIAASIGRRGH